ncbi:MAG: isoaspartyl peptidase/L-asparaginase [Chloroflexi bacterium]|nr:isoaspartyl peptidase/L-asparaginase [Chloroflexota bacterium]MBU1748696.1 isoaspartyl peptidase/L-asparaginase [Chloroflexota bacterium]
MHTASPNPALEPVLVVHGGAWNIPDDLVDAHRTGCQAALAAGWAILQAGGPAGDAVVAAIRVLEDDPTFDAGVGSFLNAAGQVELDAGLMLGDGLRAGAVAAVRDVCNPIVLAQAVLHSPHVLLVANGASQFARFAGVPRCAPADLIIPRERAAWERVRNGDTDLVHTQFGPADTVGAVARDYVGHLAAGVSTGGSLFKLPGRVGDTAVPGAGFYADDARGAVACTGHGERALRVVWAKWAIDALGGDCDPQTAAEAAVQYLETRVQGRGGLILLDAHGRVGCAFSTPRMARGWQNAQETYIAIASPHQR